MNTTSTRRGFTQKNVNVVYCPPCGESTRKGGKGVVNKDTLMDTPPSALRATSPAGGEVNGGFTLIELLVVVLIIGILAAVAVPQYQKAVAKSKYARLKPIVESTFQAQQAYYLAHGKYTLDLTELDVSLPEGWTPGNDVEVNGELARKNYIFDWGSCATWSNAFACSISINNVDVWFKKYYTGKETYMRCLAYTEDLDHLANKLCQQETHKTTPDHAPGSYVEWWYD